MWGGCERVAEESAARGTPYAQLAPPPLLPNYTHSVLCACGARVRLPELRSVLVCGGSQSRAQEIRSWWLWTWWIWRTQLNWLWWPRWAFWKRNECREHGHSRHVGEVPVHPDCADAMSYHWVLYDWVRFQDLADPSFLEIANAWKDLTAKEYARNQSYDSYCSQLSALCV